MPTYSSLVKIENLPAATTPTTPSTDLAVLGVGPTAYKISINDFVSGATASSFTIGTATVTGTLGVTGTLTAAGSIIAGNSGAAKLTLSAGSIAVASGQNMTVSMGGNAKTLTFSGTGGTGTPLQITASTTQNVVDTSVTAANLLKTSRFYAVPGTITFPAGARTDTGSPFSVSFNAAGDVSGTTDYPYYYFRVNSDSATTTQAASGLVISQNYGAGSTGGRTAFRTSLVQAAATGNAGVGRDPYYEAIRSVTRMSFNEGGTNARFSGAKGHQYSYAGYAYAQAGATYLYANIGYEQDMIMEAGASAARQVAFHPVKLAASVVQGNVTDAAILIGNQSGAAGWVDGISFADPGDVWPLDATTGTMIRARLGSAFLAKPMTAYDGINIQEADLSGMLFRGRDMAIDGAGSVRVGTGEIAATSTGVTFAATYSVGLAEGATVSGGALVAGGSGGAAVNDVLRSANGGVVYVTAVDGSGVITELTVYRRSYASGSPAVNESYTFDPSSGGSGAVTVAQTWTAGADVSVGTGSNDIYMPSLQASTSYVDDAAAAAGGVAVGQLYRNGSVVQIRIS